MQGAWWKTRTPKWWPFSLPTLDKLQAQKWASADSFLFLDPQGPCAVHHSPSSGQGLPWSQRCLLGILGASSQLLLSSESTQIALVSTHMNIYLLEQHCSFDFPNLPSWANIWYEYHRCYKSKWLSDKEKYHMIPLCVESKNSTN